MGKMGFKGRINRESTILGLMANHMDLGHTTPHGGHWSRMLRSSTIQSGQTIPFDPTSQRCCKDIVGAEKRS